MCSLLPKRLHFSHIWKFKQGKNRKFLQSAISPTNLGPMNPAFSPKNPCTKPVSLTRTQKERKKKTPHTLIYKRIMTYFQCLPMITCLLNIIIFIIIYNASMQQKAKHWIFYPASSAQKLVQRVNCIYNLGTGPLEFYPNKI